MKSARERRLQFLDPPKEVSDFDSAKVVVLPIPMEKTTSYEKGTAKGPEAMIEASRQVEFFDRELCAEPLQVGVSTDWSLASPALFDQKPEGILQTIRDRTSLLLDQGKFVLGLGGEHTITSGLVEAYCKRYPGNLTLVQVDAHADLRPEYEGSPYSHACVMHRLVGQLPIVSAGVRAMEKEEYEFAQSQGVRHFPAHEIRRNPNWTEELVESIGTENVYLTFDLDGLDPSVMPSVGTPVPGGLFWEESLALIRRIAQKHTIVGADVNELCPGPLRAGDFTAALLCYKIIGYAFESELRKADS